MQQPEQQQQQQQRNHIASVRLLLLLFLIIFTTAWGLASARSLEPKGTKGLLPLSIFSNSDRVLLHFPPLARDQPPPLEFLTDLEPFLLDVRGNIVRNTVLESTWAILLLDQLRSVQLFCDLLNGFRNSEALLAKIREKMLNDRSFSFAFADFNCDEVAEAPNMYDLEAGRAKRRLFWTTVAASQWKDVLDLHDAYLKSLEGGKEYYQRMRDNELFRIRGRIVLDSQEAGVSSVKHLRGRTSVLDKTGGIVCERYARTLLPDGGEFFSLAISHAKNLFVASRLVQLPLPSSLGDSAYVRLDDKVSNCFGVHGAPFIAGPSGSTQSIGASMLRDFVTSDTEFAATRVASLKLAESYLIIYMAYLVVAGHHSLVEGLLGCQSAGYFADIRFPLAGPGAYEQALKDLHSRAAELGLIWSDGGLDRPLSEKKEAVDRIFDKKRTRHQGLSDPKLRSSAFQLRPPFRPHSPRRRSTTTPAGSESALLVSEEQY
eukprot:gnl/Spiro4/7085_TR3685_c0_g1_i1.p1 gnl/Spiro4/7085_TR3685_c0_g1~~gnl/Spiro4/7085_TR3685_c0_g1_i1.p1  ORF type:complete len:488 (-),score=87.24 gnl/Spiro4/7085_TR3685_c0_g1_i1:227-1690(-)